MPIYRLPDLEGFEPRQDEFGYLLVADEAVLFATKLVGSQVIDWFKRTLKAELKQGFLWINGRPFTQFQQVFNFRRTLKLAECCPLLGAAYLNSTKVRDAIYLTLKDDLEREWKATLTLGALVSGNWMVEAVRSIFPVLMSGNLLPEPLSFDTGVRVITTSYGDLSLSLPAHWDVEIAGDSIKFFIPDVREGRFVYAGLGTGIIMDYRGRPEDYGWSGDEGVRVGSGEVVFWKALKRVDAQGVERDVTAVMRVSVHDPSLVQKLRNVCEIVWNSAYFGHTWPYISLGYLQQMSDLQVKSTQNSPVKQVKRTKKPSRPVSRPVKFDPFKPSPIMSTVGKVLSSPWKSARNIPTRPVRIREYKATGADVSRYNWANSSTFYVDQDGVVRSSDFNDEVAADEIGSDGTLYKDGRVVGRVSEGYVYDTQGNVVGRLDTSISDRWQLELYDQNVNPDTFGTGWSLEKDEVKETGSPFVSSYGRDDEDEEE